MTSLTAHLTGGGVQTTEWVYGVTQAGGHGLDSNDISVVTKYPDPSTGAASSSQQETRTVNALGETVNNIQQGNYGDAALDAMGAAGAWLSLLRVCFAAGTPIRTPDGAVAIEKIRPGDLVLSRSEFDPAGLVEAKVVEQVFERFGRVWHLHAGGEVIRTTGEHPFFAQGKGWVACRELAVGDRLSTESGGWIAVEDILDTGESEVVYNLCVADHHTYFAGCAEWGFAAWAHNALCTSVTQAIEAGVIPARSRGTEVARSVERALVGNNPRTAQAAEEVAEAAVRQVHPRWQLGERVGTADIPAPLRGADRVYRSTDGTMTGIYDTGAVHMIGPDGRSILAFIPD